MNSFYLRNMLIYMASLSPLPKENLLHCDIVGSLDINTCWFPYSRVHYVLLICYQMLVNKAVCNVR